jgi:hypothetical protein
MRARPTALGLASGIAIKSQRRIRRYAKSTVDDLAQTRMRNVQDLDYDEVHRKLQDKLDNFITVHNGYVFC